MIITLTTNRNGHQRLYLGGTSSLETWIEKADDGRRWTFHMADGLGGNHLSEADKRAVAVHLLADLSRMLTCDPDDLAHIPFDVIASLHSSNPCDHRRMATPRRDLAEHAYRTSPPNMRQPKGDFTAEHFKEYRRSR
ncbi:MAG: hypothetical protein ABL982_14990 [Vicinamibacterales bacterium]